MGQCLSNPYAAQVSILVLLALVHSEVYGYSSAGNILSIIMEFFPKGDLYKVLHTDKEKHPLSLLQRMRMARHTSLAIRYVDTTENTRANLQQHARGGVNAS